jgi:hypothetical protein
MSTTSPLLTVTWTKLMPATPSDMAPITRTDLP